MDRLSGKTRRFALLLLLTLALVPSPVGGQSASTTDSPASSSAILDAEWSLVRPLPVVTIQVRRAAGFALLVPALTLFTVYVFRPRPYVLAWVWAWLAASVMLLVLSFDSMRAGDPRAAGYLGTGRLAAMTWAASAVLFGASLRWGALWFRAPLVISAWLKWIVIGIAIWIVTAAMALRPGALILPAFVLMGLWHLRGAFVYLRIAREYRFIGALTVGLALLALVIGNLSAFGVAAAEGAIGQSAIRIAYLNLIWVALLVLGMHLLAFEDVMEELRASAAELARGRDEMRAMAVTDPLTRCYNRRFLDEIAPRQLQHHDRHNLPLALMYIDIDHFKAINDERGHQVGDTVLKTLGSILRARTRKADYVFRWGGDEFLVLLSASETQAKAKAEEIRQAFLDSAIIRDLPKRVGLSIGCTIVPPGTNRFEALIDRADKEMYERKRALG